MLKYLSTKPNHQIKFYAFFFHHEDAFPLVQRLLDVLIYFKWIKILYMEHVLKYVNRGGNTWTHNLS